MRSLENCSNMQLLHNAQIHTFDAGHPSASAILIDGQRVLACGEREALRGMGGDVQETDLGGRTVLPGLTDAHLHLQYYSLGLQKVDCETGTLAECLWRVEARVRTSKPGQWVLGHGWNHNSWDLPAAEGFPTAADLDAAVRSIAGTARSMGVDVEGV